MAQEILKKDENAEICIWVCDHEKAHPHCHGAIKTHLGQNTIKRWWKRGNTHFKRFDQSLAADLWGYVLPQRVGPPITHRQERDDADGFRRFE